MFKIRALVVALGMLLPFSAHAAFISAGGTFSWTEISPTIRPLQLSSSDDFDFDFLSDGSGGLLEITRIDIVLGNGLQPDPNPGPPGYLTWGSDGLFTYGGANFTGTGPDYDNFGEGTGAGARDASGYFTGLLAGSGFNFYLDIDETGGAICPACDIVTPAEFLAGGAMTYTLYFKYNGPGTIVGPSSFTFGPNSFLTGQGPDAQSNWGVRVEVEDSTVPEPGTYALMGAGLAAIGFLRRRKA
ncbi:MAG: PEP-CTERM sorting domain-containing protein [Acidobacteriota bacterium]